MRGTIPRDGAYHHVAFRSSRVCFDFFFNDTATTEIYTLSLHDALPICNLHEVKRQPCYRLMNTSGDKSPEKGPFGLDSSPWHVSRVCCALSSTRAGSARW